MKKQYRKIDVWEILDAMIDLDLNCNGSQDSVINIADLAERLGTSKYQVSSLMNCLLMAGITEKGICQPIDEFTEEKKAKPYRGFKLTEVIRIKEGDNIPKECQPFKREIMKYRAFYQKKSMIYKEKNPGAQ